MGTPFRAVQVTENVYWVGAIDWELADFHGYATPRGSTYNAFLILGDRITLIDTVKEPFYDEMMSRIRSVIDPSKIDIIISNHSEMDHSGALPKTVRAIQPSLLLASSKGKEALQAHVDAGMEITAVAEKETLDIGGATLTFIESRMVHWPDSMFTYLDRGEVLFSNDAFGMHLASTQRFDDELDRGVMDYETAKYYANILWPTSAVTHGVLKKLDGLNKSIRIIAPDHGPVWRSDVSGIMEKYRRWTTGGRDRKAVIVYATMWGSTAKLAHAVAEGVGSTGVEVVMCPLSKCHRSDIATELLNASAVIVGSPNLNAGMFPAVADVLTYVGGLKPKSQPMIGASFGSFGWSPAAAKQVEEMLHSMGCTIPESPYQIKYVPDESALEGAVEFGKKVSLAIG